MEGCYGFLEKVIWQYPWLVALRDPGLQFVHVLHATSNACHSGLQPQASIEETHVMIQIKPMLFPRTDDTIIVLTTETCIILQ